MAFDVANRSRTTQGVPQGVCYEPEEADCSAGTGQWGREVSCLSRLACNFIIAFRCMFPAVAFAIAINRRLIAHVPPLPAYPLVSCSVYACGELSFILCQLRGQRKSPWQGRMTLRDGWGEGGETKLRFN